MHASQLYQIARCSQQLAYSHNGSMCIYVKEINKYGNNRNVKWCAVCQLNYSSVVNPLQVKPMILCYKGMSNHTVDLMLTLIYIYLIFFVKGFIKYASA